MKIHTMFPAIIALAILVGGPFGFRPMCDSDPRRGVICYCCSAIEENCAVISCSDCCRVHAGALADSGWPEMIPESFPAIIPVKIVYGNREAIRLPESVYLEVPNKPPMRV
jgi:hypothetical protein